MHWVVFRMKIINAMCLIVILILVLSLPARAAEITPTGPKPTGPAVIGGAATGIVAPGINLLKNGDFEKGTAWPEGWEKTKAPGGNEKTQAGVKIELADGGAGHGRVLHMTMDQAAAEAPGMMLLSEPVAVAQGKTYHVSVEVKSMGPAVMLFVKGYGIAPGRGGSGGTETAIFTKPQSSRLKTGQWGVMSFDFTPQTNTLSEAARRVYAKKGITVPVSKVDRIRVELYAYYPAGEVYFDNVRVTEGASAAKAYISTGDASAAPAPKR